MRIRLLLIPLALVAGSCSGRSPGLTSKSSKTIATQPSQSAPPATDFTAQTDPPLDTTFDTIAPADTINTIDTVAPVDTADPNDPFGFISCDTGVDCGHLSVPIDYTDPGAGSFSIYVAVHRATDQANKLGSLLVNPGGPGFGGSDFAFFAEQVYGEKILKNFDIVAWDPRGTGQSEPAIDCVDDYDRYFAANDITPDDATERQQIIDLAKEFEDFCSTKNADILQFIGTNNSARDMDSIRQALGEDKITYFGFSYGSELGATWATLFPDTVRAAVLDGAADPNSNLLEGGLQQIAGFEASVATFLKNCSDTPDCAFNNGGDAAGAFDKLMLALDDKAVPSSLDRPDVNRGVALVAVSEAMYSKTTWPELEQALADAQKGDGAGLLSLYDQYFQRGADGVYDNSLEAFQTISCMDTVDRATVAEDDATAPQFNQAAPRMGAGTTGSYFCTFFPTPNDPRVTITGAGAGPIVVVGTTGDPATPLASSENMAKALEQGIMLIGVADQHTAYGTSTCIDDAIEGYLVDLTVPKSGTRCE